VSSAGDPASTVGVLGLQGDIDEHEAVLLPLGVAIRRVRTPDDLAGVGALVLPGGESTTLSMLLDSAGLLDPIRRRLAGGMPALGTCAGMILLATSVLDGRPDQQCLSGIDIAVRRNAFGRQRASFEADLDVVGVDGGPMHATFIRAPVIVSVGADVEVLASVRCPDGEERPVVCRAGVVTAASFHPELVGDGRLHERLVADLLGNNLIEESVL
jgi:5'-phosphate synthase pdxT subunit